MVSEAMEDLSLIIEDLRYHLMMKNLIKIRIEWAHMVIEAMVTAEAMVAAESIRIKGDMTKTGAMVAQAIGIIIDNKVIKTNIKIGTIDLDPNQIIERLL